MILFESMKGQQLDTNLFGLSSEQIHSQMHYLPARSLNTFLNYVIETQTDTFLISYFDSLLAKSVIPQFISTLVGTPKTLDEALPLMIAATKIQTPLSEIDFNIDSKHICLSRARVFHLYSNQNGADLFTLFFFKHFIKNMCGIEIPIQGVSLTSSASQKLISLLNALGITHYKFSQETQLYQIDNTYAKTTVSIRQSSSTEIKPAPVSYLDRIRAIIDSNLSDPRFSIQDLANQLGISVRTLQNTLQTQRFFI
ncbi:hypothetical protein JCM19232_523 [Vibrio ishigakensis]|uniref:HTH araC/xylS-type domain-containing protein n=1 Tax=Vibrio ishigakensis TaxID=1481914 RepID=A0A0B8P059_9VIBR|nr:hypothetical protein JCM19232_523 [Vibrio ishigakensis]